MTQRGKLQEGSRASVFISGEFSALEISRLRLHIQGLGSPRFSSPGEAVGWLGAVQSQEYAYAKWSIGKRVPGLDEAGVDRALADGAILRTHVLRPTWHYVRPQDILWMQRLTAPRVRRMMASYDRALELDDDLYARTNNIVVRELVGGRHRTRTQLAESLEAEGIPARGQRLGHILMRAELDALVCSGVPAGKQCTYALVAERAPDAIDFSPDEAITELTRRYFRSHGPATEKDFRWWASLTAGEARRAIGLLGKELESWTIDQRRYHWIPSEQPVSPRPPAAAAHLLQGYDELIVGYTESRGVLDTAGRAGPVPGRTYFQHVVLFDGQILAYWRRQLHRAGMVVQMQLLRKLARAERRAVEDAVERYARFSETVVELVT